MDARLALPMARARATVLGRLGRRLTTRPPLRSLPLRSWAAGDGSDGHRAEGLRAPRPANACVQRAVLHAQAAPRAGGKPLASRLQLRIPPLVLAAAEATQRHHGEDRHGHHDSGDLRQCGPCQEQQRQDDDESEDLRAARPHARRGATGVAGELLPRLLPEARQRRAAVVEGGALEGRREVGGHGAGARRRADRAPSDGEEHAARGRLPGGGGGVAHRSCGSLTGDGLAVQPSSGSIDVFTFTT
mmetsp:Transcript_90058/g.250608  ORF Transcript_90058/g.250608 Transcript_90058/m.250608 type:complete len:245 (+) Transcript_90058:238-972(+)